MNPVSLIRKVTRNKKNYGNMNEPKPEDPLKQKNDCNNITK